MNESELSLYFPHSDTSGRLYLDDAPESTMAVLTFLLRNFHFSSASFISVLLVMSATSQVCSEVDCYPGGAGSSGFVLVASLFSLVYSAFQADGIYFRLCCICLLFSSCRSSAANAASCLEFWFATHWILLLNFR